MSNSEGMSNLDGMNTLEDDWDRNGGGNARDETQICSIRDGAEICNLQQLYQDLLGCLALREENIPPSLSGAARGAAVMTSLGTLSQAIDEYDLLHFRQAPTEKLANFADWLQSEAPFFYEDVGETTGAPALAETDAVTVCTIHKAKGKELPAVFIPGLAEGRFPHSGQTRGRTKWHLLPRAAVHDAARYDTTLEEETRLMYVALTRSKKFLSCTFAPDPALAKPLPRSSFLTTFARCPDVQTTLGQRPLPQAMSPVQKLPPMARPQQRTLALTFSQLAAYLRCPYLFKLRTLYGWAAAPNEAEGFGKGGHDALDEIHTAAMTGQALGSDPGELAQALIKRHLLLPYASEEGYLKLAQAAAQQLAAYLTDQQAQIAGVTHAEAPFEIVLDEGLTITGRNDVVLSQGDQETLREIKSRREVQTEDISRVQLYIEDLGFYTTTGRHVDHLEVYNMAGGSTGKSGVQFREAFDPAKSKAVKAQLQEAGKAIRRRELRRLPVFGTLCQHCDHPGLCRDQPGATPRIQGN